MVFLRKHWLKDEERESGKKQKISCGGFYQLRTSKNIIYEGDNKRERFLRDIECLPQAKWMRIILQSHRCRYIFTHFISLHQLPSCLAFNFRVINMLRHETDTNSWNDDRYEQICKQRKVKYYFPSLILSFHFSSCERKNNTKTFAKGNIQWAAY
jgi:hypothetical protein